MPVIASLLIIALPLTATLMLGVFDGGGEGWERALRTHLLSDTLTTLMLIVMSAVLMLVFAVPAAWWVTMYHFPGRRMFEWLLVLPLAMPGYVMAYAYGDLTGVSGPLQRMFREQTGLDAREYWFPDVFSLPGAALVLSLVLYPYVYLGARAAFAAQSVCNLEAARTLGAGGATRFWRVALPGARPAILAGLSLALMEVAADYGALSFLGVETLTVGLFRVWDGYNDAGAAARLSLVLLALVFFLVSLERIERGRRSVAASSVRWRTLARQAPSKTVQWLMTLACVGLFAFAFVIPIGHLLSVAMARGGGTAPILPPLIYSVTIAGLGTALAFTVSIILALASRGRGPLQSAAGALPPIGYAVPGTVLAVGALGVIGWLRSLGIVSGTVTAVGVPALLLVYATRFSAVSSNAIRAAMERAPDSMTFAARGLGAGPTRRALRLDLPIAAPGVAVGALILFVEILKELPATLMFALFDWDTLAIQAYQYASDSRLEAAALPSILITAVGLLPVIILSRRIAKGRAGYQA